ncbi:MAG TPA: DUF4349 domain-containing protein [Polyangiaceae bacterium]
MTALSVVLAAAALLAGLACTGCAGEMKAEAAPSVAIASPAPAPPPPPAGGPGVPSPSGGQEGQGLLAMNDADAAKAVAATKAVSDAPHSAAMLIYTATLSMSVYQVGPQLDAVEKVARDLGGYLSAREDASITIRVPRDRFDETLARIEKLGEVTHRDIKAQDVTDQYVDLQARLKNAYAIRDKLTELLSRAAVKDAIEIEKELGRVTEDIERMEGKMKLLRDQIAFSTVTVDFAPVEAQQVHDSSLLAPFPWLDKLGLHSLLEVHQ